MKHYSLLFLLFCCTFFFSSCSDEEGTPNREEALMNKRWQITSFNANTSFGAIDFYADFEDCERDNFIEFRSDGVLIMDEGATKCNSGDDQQMTGTWSLEGDILTLSGIGMTYDVPINEIELTVTELTETRFMAEFSETFSGFEVAGTMSMETM